MCKNYGDNEGRTIEPTRCDREAKLLSIAPAGHIRLGVSKEGWNSRRLVPYFSSDIIAMMIALLFQRSTSDVHNVLIYVICFSSRAFRSSTKGLAFVLLLFWRPVESSQLWSNYVSNSGSIMVCLMCQWYALRNDPPNFRQQHLWSWCSTKLGMVNNFLRVCALNILL